MGKVLGYGVIAVLFSIVNWSMTKGLGVLDESEEVTVSRRSSPIAAAQPSGPAAAPAQPGGAPAVGAVPAERSLQVVTLLPFDAIPSIDSPRFVSVQEAAASFESGEKVIGNSLNGESHVYSVPQLSSHEIVNDVVGGVPVAITW